MRIMTNLDVNFNEISNAIVNGIIMKPLATAPENPIEGQFYYNSLQKKAFQYDGVNWIPMGGTIVGSEGDMVTVTFTDGEISAALVNGSITKEKFVKAVQDTLTNADTHMSNTDIHVTTEDKTNWADKYTKDETDKKIGDAVKVVADNLDEHEKDTVSHVTAEDKVNWADKYTKEETDAKVKEVSDNLDEHEKDTVTHVTAEDKTNWADKYTKEEIDSKVNIINGTTDDLQTQITNTNNALNGHVEDTDIHVTAEDKAIWADKYTKTETDSAIATAIANADHLKREIVTELPTENIDANTIYMIKKGSSANGDNYEEYMLIDGSLVKIGDTTVDLTDYLTKTGDASDTTVTFIEATEDKPELTTGDKISVLIGKIKKLFNSLHAVAKSGDYNDLTNKIEILTEIQTTQEKTYTLSVDTTVAVYSVELEMNGEKVIGDITYSENGFTVKFSEVPESEIKVKALYTK